MLATAVGLDAINDALEETTTASERVDSGSSRPGSRDVLSAYRASVLTAQATAATYTHLVRLAELFETAAGPDTAAMLTDDIARAMDASRKARVTFHEISYNLRCFD